MKFEDTGLKAEIIKGVKELGFEHTMPIQEKVIAAMLEHRSDLIGIAQTGTGKTAAYGLPLLHLVDPTLHTVQALILTPTRELCIQVADDLTKFAKYTKSIEVAAIYGGASIESQMRALKQNVQLVVGTPGRLRDLIRRKKLNIKAIKTVVLDEADEMLSMGFKEELNAILAETPSSRQTLLFSATMPREIAEIAENYMNDPIEIAIGKRNVGADNVRHQYYMVNASDRYLALKRIVDSLPEIYGIVFCRTRKETKEIAEKLIADGYNADALHGDLSQGQRDQVMNRFRNNNLQMLVATDVAARGLDVTDLTHIINYNLPDECETYIHRSGRTGRAGKTGTCLTIIHSREKSKIKIIEKKMRKDFDQKSIPSGTEICEKQLVKLIEKMETAAADNTLIEQFLPTIYKKLESLSREELIKHFFSLEFNRFLEYYKNAPDLNVLYKDKKSRNDGTSKTGRSERNDRRGKPQRSSGRPNQPEFSRFFINAGSQDGLVPSQLIGIINESTKKRDIEIGKIEIMKKFSFFEVDAHYTDRVIRGFENTEYNGREVIVEPAQDKKELPGSPGRALNKKSSKGKPKKAKKTLSKPRKKKQ
jgi:ATP-dependent RNA helicase DeaD